MEYIVLANISAIIIAGFILFVVPNTKWGKTLTTFENTNETEGTK